MPEKWRLVDSGLVPPAESAALDEAVLETHIRGAVPQTLHFYRRSVPTISLGYFEKVEDSVFLSECESRGVAIIRRKSGGRSIYTDSGQLIYGLVLDSDDIDKRESVFGVVCGALAKAISSFGLNAEYRPPNDVEVMGRKISGNAQLVRKGSVLQHGTILVDTDLETMDAVLRVTASKSGKNVRPSERVTTMASLLGRPPLMELVKTRIESELGKAFGVEFEHGEMTEQERSIARELVREKYSRNDWNFRL